MATTAELIASIDAQLETIIASPEVDYQIGELRVSASQKAKQLLDMKKQLLQQPDIDVDTMAFDFDVNEFGEDSSQFES